VGPLEAAGAGALDWAAGSPDAGADPEAGWLVAAGVLLQLTGSTLFLWCSGRLAVVGRGRPADVFAGVVGEGGACDGAGGFCAGGGVA